MAEATQQASIDVARIRDDFPILSRKEYGKPLVYLDNAATSQKPRQVIEASDEELYLNAMTHYWTYGTWKPKFEKHPRLPSFEQVNFKEIKLFKLPITKKY